MLPEPGVLEMNLTLGSSWPTYHLLSMNRSALPFTILMGSVHRSPASFLTVPYFGLQPLQSSSLTALGATAPVAAVVAVFAAVAAVAATAEPVTLSWQMTAKPSAGTSSSRHFRPPAAAIPARTLSMIPALPRECACAILLAHACRQSQSVPQARRSRRCDRPAIRDAFRRNLTITANSRQSSTKPLSIP